MGKQLTMLQQLVEEFLDMDDVGEEAHDPESPRDRGWRQQVAFTCGEKQGK